MANTVQEALVACGVNTINNVIGRQNNSERMAIDMFGSIFETCMRQKLGPGALVLLGKIEIVC